MATFIILLDVGFLYIDEIEIASTSEDDCDYHTSEEIGDAQSGVVTDDPYTREEKTEAQKNEK